MAKHDVDQGAQIFAPELLAHLAAIRSRGMMEDFWIDFGFSTLFTMLNVALKNDDVRKRWAKALRKLSAKIALVLGEEE